MRVVVPHTADGLRSETRDAVLAHAPDAEFVELTDDEAYWRLWCQLWAEEETFAIVEQDIVPGPLDLQAFEECPGAWCAHEYEYSRFGLYAGTGCVRFRAELLTATRGLMERVGEMSNQTHPPRHWCTLDAFRQAQLHADGHHVHIHEPAVEHLDTGCSHGCVPAY